MSLKTKKLQWIDPLEIADNIASNYNGNWIFLYSGLNFEIENSVSTIGIFPKKELFLQDLNEMKKYLEKDNESYFGYVSYEYKNKLENFTKTQKSFIDLPKIYFANFALILQFNHKDKTLNVFYDNDLQLQKVLNYKVKNSPKKEIKVENFKSNFSNSSYLKAIEDIKKMIAKGDFYQTNLTRKFYGKVNFESNKDYFDIFAQLTKTSAANYSSFLKINDNFIISSSPELFFKAKNKQILSRPIKGTSPRGKDEKQDEENKKYLQNSQKEKAENLMIVDLVRNDLSRICKASSVKVKNLFAITSYKNLHHMSSEIIGKIDEKNDVVDAFKSCFPPGSMTGAPKIKAIEISSKLEQINRGIYSGAIGYFKGLNECNFSVVIRTLICKKSDFEFQTGGAITFDSDAKSELDETLTKAKAIFETLNIKP